MRNEADGTHSIIDISGISADRTELPRGAGFAEGFEDDYSDFGRAKQLTDESLQAWFGTTTPSREEIAAVESDLFNVIGRWQALVITVYVGETPTEYFFTGVTGD